MKEFTNEGKKQQCAGYIYTCESPDGSTACIHVDCSGNVILADHGNWLNGTTRYHGEEGFESAVVMAMRRILDSDIVEFKKMRSRLNPHYLEIAESIRRDKMAEYNF